MANSDDSRRLGRAIIFVHQHDSRIQDPFVRAEVETLLLTGRAMDFAARLRGHGRLVVLTDELVRRYAGLAGIGQRELVSTVLPSLKDANLVDYRVTEAGQISDLQEFVGVSATVTEQTVSLLRSLNPTRSDLAFLHSVEIGAVAPLTAADHLEQLSSRGYTDEEATRALKLAKAVGLNLTAHSTAMNEDVVFSPYVWGTKQLSLAQFLAGLPSAERDALLGLSEQVLATPGLHMSQLTTNPAVIRSAQSVGLIQSATVQSAAGASSTYVFSPLLEAEDNKCTTTEAFHQRKLFVAHIMFGHEKAKSGFGRIASPTTLVDSLVRKGTVGPATNIKTDYHLLEAAGVVSVEPQGDRALLHLIKPEIATAGLEWIRRISDPGGERLTLSQQPAKFIKPEDARAQTSGATNELMTSAVLELRKEMQRAARRDNPWA